MKKLHKTPFAIAIGASLLPLTVSASQIDNPFALSDLGSGYMQTAEAGKGGASKMKDGACGEGKCGGAMMQKSTDSKALEGKCAGNKPAPAAEQPKDGKQPEMKCGADMKM